MSADSTYDDLPYPGSPFPQTHPIRLATIATLFGMQPPAVETCRVLELGCTDGGNLIPMAVAFPNAEFVGLDLSKRQIEAGQKIVDATGISNIQLFHEDILAVEEQFGKFDYVIAHGVYSWVPEVVQEKILAIIKQLLTPQGVGYVSYNTYPGWRMRGMLRDMMLYHTRRFSDNKQRIEQARALIDFLAKASPADGSAYNVLLSGELESMQTWPDSYIFHESLEAHNEPLYFHEFVERANKHGLRYLGEAALSAMLTSDLSDEVTATLQEVGRDIVEMEQYMDFVRNRTFRQTLLCHDDVALDRTLSSEVVEGLQVRANLTPESETPDLLSVSSESFRSPDGTVLTAHQPVQKIGFAVLRNHWPRHLSYNALVEQTRTILRSNDTAFVSGEAMRKEAEDLRDSLFQCFCDHLIDLHVTQPRTTNEVAERPVASVLARHTAEPSGWITTLTHEQIQLDEVTARMLPLLDGTRDLSDLTSAMLELTKDGTIVATREGSPITDTDEIESELRDHIQSRLQELAAAGVLTDSA